MLCAPRHRALESKRSRPRWELADIFRQFGPAYVSSRPLASSVLKVIGAIQACRTASLGGHLEECDQCGFKRSVYNSCRNRHCPKCQALAKARWLDARISELLPVGYFHNVFTLPHELNGIALANKKVVCDLLFKAVASTLQEFAAHPRRGKGGKLGFTAILHTWDQKLKAHFHLHCVIPAGVLSHDSSRWIHARRDFLFAVLPLAKLFRAKFLFYLRQEFNRGSLIFPAKLLPLASPMYFSRLIDKLYGKSWVVYSKAPFQGPQKVFDYLGRYTHRIAISNHRILNVQDGSVTFYYRDRRDGDKLKTMSLTALEFIHRFLLHTIPSSFVRIRHFGFLANRSKQKDLNRCRELLKVAPQPLDITEKSTEELMRELTGIDLSRCPNCKKGKMLILAEIPKVVSAVKTRLHFFDSS